MIECHKGANSRRERTAEEIHEFLVNENGFPERDILAKANPDGVVVEVHKNAGRDDE